MAKLTTLEIVNNVLRNCGEEEVENLNNLSGIQSTVWDKIIEALLEICTDQDTRLKFLEEEGAVIMVEDTYKYSIASLEPEEVEKERKVVIEEIKMNEDKPQRVLLSQIHRAMFDNLAYSYPVIGFQNIIETVPRDVIYNY